MESIDRYLCDCFFGFYGVDCNVVNYCFDNLCGWYGKCRNIESGFICMCDNGLVGDDCLFIDFCFILLCG